MSNSLPGTSPAWTALTKSRFAIIAILLSFLGISAYAGTKVTTSGYVLEVNGAPFAIKGIDYAPVPIGVLPGDQPYGDYFVPGYKNVWQPDIDKIRAAGVNVIRLYAGNPDLNAGAPGSAGNWKQFLDYCYNGGTTPDLRAHVFLHTRRPDRDRWNQSHQNYLRQYTELVQSTVTHPAVFGYCLATRSTMVKPATRSSGSTTESWSIPRKARGSSQGKKPFLTTAITDNLHRQHSGQPSNWAKSRARSRILMRGRINIYRGPVTGRTRQLALCAVLGR